LQAAPVDTGHLLDAKRRIYALFVIDHIEDRPKLAAAGCWLYAGCMRPEEYAVGNSDLP
jgi:hypothetical protein